jgi:hypothetical protein
MAKWEAVLFRAGAGCPSCEGVAPETSFEPATLADIENGDGDPMERLIAFEQRDNRPAWKAPDPVLLYRCDCCGIEVQDDPGADCEEDRLFCRVTAASDLQYRNSARISSGRYYTDDEIRAGFTFDKARDKPRVCPACVEHCDDCGRETCSALSTDVYDGLASFSGDQCGGSWRRSYCIDCFETRAAEAEAEADDDETETEADDDAR